MTRPYRLCKAGVSLRSEVTTRWPRRDTTSDGWIGDAAHAARTSDHNPWLVKDGVGIVRAIDIDVDGVDMGWLMEHLRQLGAARDRRLWPNGYLIFNRRITNPDFGAWRAYTGSNAHTHHGHVSFSTDPVGFDEVRGWGLSGAGPAVTPATTPAGPATTTPGQEDDDMNPTQARQLAEVHAALTQPIKAWDAHGTGDPNVPAYNTVQYVLRANEQGVRLREDIARLQAQMADVYSLLRSLPTAITEQVTK